MNATVARIVEIMFQDAVMSDEVQALKDEVMNNCQERYEDMRARGMDEDEAIAAVVDSLKGMEEVIAQYPRKAGAVPVDDTEDEDPEKDLVFDAEAIRKIRVLLTSDDVNFESSTDDLVHVYYDQEEMPNLSVCLEKDVLKIERTSTDETYGKAHIEAENLRWGSLSEVLNSVKTLIDNVHVKVQLGGGGDVTIALPAANTYELDVHVTSADVNVDGVRVNQAYFESTSGDLSVELENDVAPDCIRVKGSSGDVEVTANTRQLSIQTVSGDVVYTGICPDINVTTVSGDAEISGTMQTVNLKTVSGDVDMSVENDTLRSVNCTTTSGDLTVVLPSCMRGQVGVSLNTVSGDVNNRFGEPLGAPVAQVNARSVSGDVTIR